MSTKKTEEALHARYEAEANAQLPAHLDRLAWSQKKIARYRRAQLQRLLGLAREKSSWHRARLRGLDIRRITEENLSDLPTMTKTDLMESFDEILTDSRLSLDALNAHLKSARRRAYFLDAYQVLASGGSSGLRGVFVYDANGWITLANGARRWFLKRALEKGQPPSPARRAAIFAEGTSHISSALANAFPPPGEYHQLPIVLPITKIVDALNAIAPTELSTYPSVLPVLAAEARAGRLKIRPSALLTCGESLVPEVVEIARATWGVEPEDYWGMSEGAHAISCTHGEGMHLADDLGIIEPVDANGNPVAPGVRAAKFFFTNLYNTVQPLIRYEVTDEIILLSEPCPCGSGHRRMGSVSGRLDDVFTYGDIPVHCHTFEVALGREPNILEYKVLQTERGASIEIHKSGPVDIQEVEASVVAGLAKAGVANAEVRVAVVEKIFRQSSGKLKRFVAISK